MQIQTINPHGFVDPPPEVYLASPAGGPVPAAAANLTAAAPTFNLVNLKWTASIGTTGYILQRATNAAFTANLTSFNITGGGTTAYSDNTVAGSTTFYYRIIASNLNGNSAPSNIATVITPAPTPTPKPSPPPGPAPAQALAPPPFPAIFVHSGLSITPDTVRRGGTVIISHTCTNKGGSQGKAIIPLMINGVKKDTTEITLDPGAFAKVDFVVQESVPGTYDVEIQGLTGTFTVEPVAGGQRGFKWWWIVVGIIGLAVIGIGFVGWRRSQGA